MADVARRTAADTTADAISPYGGTLVNHLLQGEAASDAAARARTLRRVPLTPPLVADLDLLANGAYSPLTGFMGPEDYRAVVDQLHLAGGLPWTIPVVLPLPKEMGDALPRPDETIALTDAHGEALALMRVDSIYQRDAGHEAELVYGTREERHPGVARVYSQGTTLLGGPVSVFRRPMPEFPQYALDPLDTRRIFRDRGWKRVVAFQTRNPIHRAHEYIQKCALEISDGLLLHPLVGVTKADDVPAAVRFRAYETVVAHYYPAERVQLAAFPAAMRYAGPREAVHHAIARRNYGCTHIVIGRDHAGVGGYYGTYDSQKIFDGFEPGALGIEPLRFEHAFYCRICGCMASARTCPHHANAHVVLSGTKVRAMLAAGECPPPEFSRPEVARLLVEAYRRQVRAQSAG